MKDLLLSSRSMNSILKGDFVLSSGEKSDYYIDARTSTLSAESLGCIADIFYQQIDKLKFVKYYLLFSYNI